MKARLISKTIGVGEYEGKTIDEIIVGIARISSGRSAETLFDDPIKLLRHCLTNGHWSVFATCNLGIEITTSRAIGRELLRHWSLSPQEFSQRYAEVSEYEPIELREQSKSNRQSSTITMDASKVELGVVGSADDAISSHLHHGQYLYTKMMQAGVARECARMILPETTQTVIYFNGKVRDWITMLNVRLHKTAQKECQEVAREIAWIIRKECPIIAEALGNFYTIKDDGSNDCYEIPFLDQLILNKYKVKP